MKFDWDLKKAEFNLKKHKVSFEEATTVFFDDLAKITFDPDHSDDEHRQILIGHSYNRRLLFVIHVSIEEKNTIRIISARKATKRERKDFENL
ncbi:MAG: BrnT family toxin [Bdellovibrionaceae bacterium]|nr:BrnT family toxin [Pseudobdellovibrionaceae bacterium]